MQFKLVAILFALAQVAPLAQAIPVDTAPAAQGDDFMCVSETSFSLGGEVIECVPGTYCKDVGDRGGSPCVSESSGDSCPMDMGDAAPDDTTDTAPAATGNSTIVADPAPTGNSTMPAASNDTAVVKGPGEQTTDVAATTDVQPSAVTETDAVNTLTDAAAASGVDTLTDAAPTIIAAAYRPNDGSRPDWQGPPGAPNTQEAPPVTTALAPAASDPAAPAVASSSVIPPLDANAAAPTVPAATAVLPSAVVTTEAVPAVTTAAAAVVPADSAAVAGQITAGDITFNPAKQDQLGACGELMTMDRHVALSQEIYGTSGTIPDNPNHAPHCFKTITITYKGAVAAGVPVVDKCMGCVGNDLDVSPSVFTELFGAFGGQGLGRVPGLQHVDMGHGSFTWD